MDPNLGFRPQNPGKSFILLFQVFIRFSLGFWIKRKSICLRKLEVAFWTYGFVKSFGPNWPKSSCQAPDSRLKIYCKCNILGVHQIFLWTLDKLSICKMGSRVFWSYSLVSLSFGPNWCKRSFLILEPQLIACSDIQVKTLHICTALMLLLCKSFSHNNQQPTKLVLSPQNPKQRLLFLQHEKYFL